MRFTAQITAPSPLRLSKGHPSIILGTSFPQALSFTMSFMPLSSAKECAGLYLIALSIREHRAVGPPTQRDDSHPSPRVCARANGSSQQPIKPPRHISGSRYHFAPLHISSAATLGGFVISRETLTNVVFAHYFSYLRILCLLTPAFAGLPKLF